MLVKDLIKELEKMDPNLIVYLQKDPEGNGYDTLYAIDDECIFWEDTVYSTKWSADDAGFDEEDWEEFKKRERCVVLAP